MPPMITDDESEGSDVPDAIPAKALKLEQPTDEQKDDDDDDDDAEDEYEIEKIVDHKFDKKGNLSYKIKWLGYDEEADHTWEPLENVEHATLRINEYKAAIGGTPEPPQSTKKSASAKKGTKRVAEESPVPVAKKRSRRSRKSGLDAPETNGVKKTYKYPDGLWESFVTQVDSIIQDTVIPKQGKVNAEETQLHGFLKWDDGHQSSHPMRILRAKCPQKLLDYYEQHLVFSKTEIPF